MQEQVMNDRFQNLIKNAEGMKELFDYRGEYIEHLEKEIEELKTCKENLMKELNIETTSKAIDLKNHQAREMALVDELAKKNEEIKKLKTEVTEALAKRDYWQDLANKEAADAKKVKWDCEKETEWQKKIKF